MIFGNRFAFNWRLYLCTFLLCGAYTRLFCSFLKSTRSSLSFKNKNKKSGSEKSVSRSRFCFRRGEGCTQAQVTLNKVFFSRNLAIKVQRRS